MVKMTYTIRFKEAFITGWPASFKSSPTWHDFYDHRSSPPCAVWYQKTHLGKSKIPSRSLTASFPLKSYRNPIGKQSSNHHFSGAKMLNFRGVIPKNLISFGATFLGGHLPHNHHHFCGIPNRRWMVLMAKVSKKKLPKAKWLFKVSASEDFLSTLRNFCTKASSGDKTASWICSVYLDIPGS